MRLATLLLGLGACAVSAAVDLSGEWYQTFSSHLVQSTFEIDWKCVRVSVHPVEEESGKYEVSSTARLHGGPVVYHSPPTTYELVNDKLVSGPLSYDVHSLSNGSTLVLTNEFQPLVFVLERSLTKRHSLATLQKKLAQWGIPPDYDSALVESYDPPLCQ